MTASPDNTVVGPSGTITDTAGHVWGISPGGKVTMDGKEDPPTGRVLKLAYEGGKIWQQNADNLWWAKSSPNAEWLPGPGTPISPIPATTAQPIATQQPQPIVTQPQASPVATVAPLAPNPPPVPGPIDPLVLPKITPGSDDDFSRLLGNPGAANPYLNSFNNLLGTDRPGILTLGTQWVRPADTGGVPLFSNMTVMLASNKTTDTLSVALGATFGNIVDPNVATTHSTTFNGKVIYLTGTAQELTAFVRGILFVPQSPYPPAGIHSWQGDVTAGFQNVPGGSFLGIPYPAGKGVATVTLAETTAPLIQGTKDLYDPTDGPVAPFAGVTVINNGNSGEADNAQIKILVNGQPNGSVGKFNGLSEISPGVYKISGVTDMNSALRQAQFVPSAAAGHQTVAFELAVTNKFGTTSVDQKAIVHMDAAAPAPERSTSRLVILGGGNAAIGEEQLEHDGMTFMSAETSTLHPLPDFSPPRMDIMDLNFAESFLGPDFVELSKPFTGTLGSPEHVSSVSIAGWQT